jgi:protoporphyrin/coproporphyrin ferrochelatase
LFSDTKIIKMPGGTMLSKPIAKLVSKIRKSTTAEYYAGIGGTSPLLRITMAQATALETLLNKEMPCKVFVAMRYWHPFIEEVLDEISKEQYEQIIMVPLFPQYSETTTGSFLEHFKEVAHLRNLDMSRIKYVKSYQTNGNYLNAMIDRLHETIQRNAINLADNAAIVVSAHSIPKSMVERGDPYPQQIKETYEGLESKIAHHISAAVPVVLGFQSKIRPFQWLKPAVIDVVEDLAGKGMKTVIVVPLSFVADNMETLFELGVTIKREALKKGIKNYYLVECVNDHEKFIRCLHELVMRAGK